MYDLKDKVIIITGGVGLLGRKFTMACAECGASVVVADVNESAGKEFVEKVRKETGNENVIFALCNITDARDIGRTIDATLDRFHKIDALVNNAYPRNKSYGKKFEDVTYEDFCENVDMHMGGYFLMSKEVAKVMMGQKYGNILSIASIYGFAAPRFDIYEDTTMTMPVEYAVIKGGLINLTKYLASYLGKYDIRVNVISPGGIYDRQPESFVKKYNQKVLLGKRMGNTEDITGALLFLLSDASAYVTGQNIVVDGGWSL